MIEKVISLIQKQKKELHNVHIGHFPTIYYIGQGKSGSASIKLGFPNNQTAHWHSESYFEKIFHTNILTENKITLLDIVVYASKKYKIKPLIIECVREPISRGISEVFQSIYVGRNRYKNADHCINFLNTYQFNFPYYAPKWLNYFNVDIKKEWKGSYFYKETDDVKLLFLRYEDIKHRKRIFEKIGYNYQENSSNVTKERKGIGRMYLEVLKRIKISNGQFKNAFYKTDAKYFYSGREIDYFRRKFI